MTDGGAAGLRAVATFEASKGALAFLAGSGLLLLGHADLHDLHDLVDALARHLHLNPGRLHPGVIGEVLRGAEANLRWIALGTVAYASLRFTEAWGLWHERAWAEWFGVVSGLVYVPFDAVEIAHRPGLPSFALLAINVLVVGYLARQLALRRRTPPP